MLLLFSQLPMFVTTNQEIELIKPPSVIEFVSMDEKKLHDIDFLKSSRAILIDIKEEAI